MNELFLLLPSWADVLKVPVIMLVTSFSVAVIVIPIRLIFHLLKKAFHAIFDKHEQS